MSEIYQLLAIAKKVATEAGDLLYQNLDTEAKVYTFSKSFDYFLMRLLEIRHNLISFIYCKLLWYVFFISNLCQIIQ